MRGTSRRYIFLRNYFAERTEETAQLLQARKLSRNDLFEIEFHNFHKPPRFMPRNDRRANIILIDWISGRDAALRRVASVNLVLFAARINNARPASRCRGVLSRVSEIARYCSQFTIRFPHSADVIRAARLVLPEDGSASGKLASPSRSLAANRSR